jgi:BMFP domain-containing protein YqiC
MLNSTTNGFAALESLEHPMRANKTLIDDIMSLGGNLLGNMLGARHEMKAQAKQRVGSLTRQLDLVSRAEFDAAFAMLAKARTMQDELAERLDGIESKLKMSSGRSGKATAKRRLPSVKKSEQRAKRN